MEGLQKMSITYGSEALVRNYKWDRYKRAQTYMYDTIPVSEMGLMFVCFAYKNLVVEMLPPSGSSMFGSILESSSSALSTRLYRISQIM